MLVLVVRYGASTFRLTRNWITAPNDVKAIKEAIAAEREANKTNLAIILDRLDKHDERQGKITTEMAVRTALWKQFVDDRHAQDALILAAIARGSPKGDKGDTGPPGPQGSI